MESLSNLHAYSGHWVALVKDGQVAGVGVTPDAAARQAGYNRPRERFTLQYVEPPGGQPLALSPLLDQLRPVLHAQDTPVYLVGGAVRDALSGYASHDLDFVTPSGGINLAFRIGNALGWPAYILDKKRDTGRVVLANDRTMLDFACFRGPDLASDLRDRDLLSMRWLCRHLPKPAPALLTLLAARQTWLPAFCARPRPTPCSTIPFAPSAPCA